MFSIDGLYGCYVGHIITNYNNMSRLLTWTSTSRMLVFFYGNYGRDGDVMATFQLSHLSVIFNRL